MNRTVLVTGASGFLAGHLRDRLESLGARIVPVDRHASQRELVRLLAAADAVAHLAGVTRASDPEEFDRGNRDTTAKLAAAIEAAGVALPVVYASSIRAAGDTPYGRSKRAAEDILIDMQSRTGTPVAIFRLPSFFGQWSQPNYNSAIATFCYQVATGAPVIVNTPTAPLQLVEIDVVVDALTSAIEAPLPGVTFSDVSPVYTMNVGEAARIIEEIGAGNADEISCEPNLLAGLRRTYQAHVARLGSD